MKTYVCDMCGIDIADPHSVEMKEFCFTVDNSDIHQVPTKDTVKVKIHLCNNCFEKLKAIAKEKVRAAKIKAEEAKAEEGKYFTPAQVRAMTAEEVKANYAKIINSMSRWH